MAVKPYERVCVKAKLNEMKSRLHTDKFSCEYRTKSNYYSYELPERAYRNIQEFNKKYEEFFNHYKSIRESLNADWREQEAYVLRRKIRDVMEVLKQDKNNSSIKDRKTGFDNDLIRHYIDNFNEIVSYVL